jgi:hypothetical protein
MPSLGVRGDSVSGPFVFGVAVTAVAQISGSGHYLIRAIIGRI